MLLRVKAIIMYLLRALFLKEALWWHCKGVCVCVCVCVYEMQQEFGAWTRVVERRGWEKNRYLFLSVCFWMISTEGLLFCFDVRNQFESGGFQRPARAGNPAPVLPAQVQLLFWGVRPCLMILQVCFNRPQCLRFDCYWFKVSRRIQSIFYSRYAWIQLNDTFFN